jgi:hypothetical protein
MDEEIESVKKTISDKIINNINIRGRLPLYILTTFNDPYVQVEVSTHDVNEFEDALYYLETYGGGDCAEMAGTGILMAVEASNVGGEIWVFTDASAKDSWLTSWAVFRALLKKVKINFCLTGSCSPIDPVSCKSMCVK